MERKNKVLLNWGLGLGIVSVFLFEFFVIPIAALIVNYIAIIKYDYINKDKGIWKGIVGFSLGIIYFLVFLYSNEKNSAYFSVVAFRRQSLLFLAIVAFFAYFPITRFRETGGFKSVSLSKVNIVDYEQEEISHNEITDTIIKLSEMVDKGILTQEEFDSKKKDLLNRL